MQHGKKFLKPLHNVHLPRRRLSAGGFLPLFSRFWNGILTNFGGLVNLSKKGTKTPKYERKICALFLAEGGLLLGRFVVY